jgi:hypothetical protein
MKDNFGNFFAGQWVTLSVSFKFSVNNKGNITSLDIGRVR